ncbi:MAG: hypothetical protein ACR2OO_06470 [Thermomicrobiales bacterium]
MVEGEIDQAVVARLFRDTGVETAPAIIKGGKAKLLGDLEKYDQAALFQPCLVLVDLDHSHPCAPAALAAWLPKPAPMMNLRIAVREVESWLLADQAAIASFLGVDVARVARVANEPDALAHPKLTLVQLAGKSKRRDIRDDIPPRPGSGRTEGPGYMGAVLTFVRDQWNPRQASLKSDSMRRCMARVDALAVESIL